jgi:hypothetical protein
MRFERIIKGRTAMTTSTAKPRKAVGRKKAAAKNGLSLPPAISTLEIEGKRYFLTPEADMTEWLEDLEDVVDSIEAMRDAAKAIPWEEAKKALGLATPSRTRK